MSYPNLNIKVFADGANLDDMLKRYKEGFCQGFTTNPTLMAKAGILDYESFAKSVLKEIKDLPISFEVFSDDFDEMHNQALKIASWGDNVNVKIPITNTKGESSAQLIHNLLHQGVKLNITAVFTEYQLFDLQFTSTDNVIISVFAGRIADTGLPPERFVGNIIDRYKSLSNIKVLWASPRQVLNIYQADRLGCHIITATDDLINKLSLHDKPLEEYSLDTVKMFYNDAKKAGYSI